MQYGNQLRKKCSREIYDIISNVFANTSSILENTEKIMIRFLNRPSLKYPQLLSAQTAVAPFVLEILCFPCLSFCPLALLLLFFHILSISPPFSLHQQSILPVLREYTKGCEIVRAYTRSRNWRKMRARTKGFMQNKECKYKVDGVDSLRRMAMGGWCI